MSVAVGAVQAALQRYSGGIVTSKYCTNLDHGVLVVSTGQRASLSEQQVVVGSKQNSGCNGGLIDYALLITRLDLLLKCILLF